MIIILTANTNFEILQMIADSPIRSTEQIAAFCSDPETTYCQRDKRSSFPQRIKIQNIRSHTFLDHEQNISNKTMELTAHSAAVSREARLVRSQTCQSHAPLPVDGSSSLRSQNTNVFPCWRSCNRMPVSYLPTLI